MTFRRRPGALILGSLLAIQAFPSLSRSLEDRTYRNEFQRGKRAVTIREGVSGGGRLVYRLAAKAGLTLAVQLSSAGRLVAFRLLRPGNGRTESRWRVDATRRPRLGGALIFRRMKCIK
jgi:hypothetical protein